MPRYTITLLGSLQARLPDQALVRLEGKTGLLFAYLVTESERAHARQTLAELFWPERSQAQALSSLRFALSNLRSMLQDQVGAQPVLRVDRSQVQLNPQADIWVDVTAFQEQAIAFEAQAAAGNPPAVVDLQAALASYQGSFLQNIQWGNSLVLETWILSKREQIERQHLRLLYFLGAGLESAGDFSQAEEAYHRILVLQPWNENVHQRLMHLLASTGHYSAALAQYENCRLVLSEFDIEPGRETNLLYHHIKKEQAAATRFEAALPGALDQQHPPFVARERELDRLDAFLGPALAGQGQVVLITGEAGSGKTALLQEFAKQALACHPDLLVVGGRCNTYAGLGQPYQPFIESVQMLAGSNIPLPWIAQLPKENTGRLKQATPQVVSLLLEKAPDLLDRFVSRNDLAQRLQELGTPPHIKPAWEKALKKPPIQPSRQGRLEAGILFEQVTRLLSELSQLMPVLLLLDDMQWGDPGSAALLFHLARRTPTCRILTLVTYRASEVHTGVGTGEHPLLGVVTELQRYAGNIRLDLDQIDERAFTTAFVMQDPLLQPNELEKSFCAALARRTAGNPLFTIELLRSLQARGDLQRREDGTWVASKDLDWDHLPARVEAAIARRVARLSAEWLDWLSTASVQGESFSAEVLAQVHDLPEKAIIQDLSGPLSRVRGGHRLLQAEGLHWLGANAGQAIQVSRYRFRHSLFQTYLYQQLDPVERSRRHLAIGLALEKLYAGEPELLVQSSAELARHFDSGALPDKAASYHLEAGKQAVFLASAPVAVSHYRRALELLAELPPTAQRKRLEIRVQIALGAPFLSASGWGGAQRQQAIQRAFDLLQETGLVYQKNLTETNPQAAEWQELLLTLYAQTDWLVSQGKIFEAILLGKQLVVLAGEQTSELLAMAHRVLGSGYLFQGNFAAARYHLETALTVNQAIRQPELQWWLNGDFEVPCRAMLGFVLTVHGYPEQGWQQISQSLQRARSLNRFAALGSALIFGFEVATVRKDLPALQKLTSELQKIGQIDAEELDFFRAYGYAANGYLQVLQAEPGSAQALAGIELVQKGMQLWQGTGTLAGWGQWVVRLADACLQGGYFERGLEMIMPALEIPDNQWFGAGLTRIHWLRGELLQKIEPANRNEAEASFLKALEIAHQQEAHTPELSAAISLAKLWQTERPSEARQLLTKTCEWFTEGWESKDWLDAQNLLKILTM